jgi:hypothetical protein
MYIYKFLLLSMFRAEKKTVVLAIEVTEAFDGNVVHHRTANIIGPLLFLPL